MRTITKFVAAAAVAITVSALAAPSQAAQVFATQTNTSMSTNFAWTNNGVTGAGAGGTLVGSGVSATNFLTFLDPLFMANFIPADFTLTATSTAGPATQGSGSIWTQTGLSGSFSFTYSGVNQVFGGKTVTTGSNLLSGTFTNGWIQGNGASGSTNISLGNGGTACFSSDYLLFGCGPTSKNEYSFSLLSVNPGFGANANSSLNSFVASGQGVFSVPEPGTWALMIMGFGGAGAMLRSRRRANVLTA
jgi:hypothetical protein